MKAAVREAIKKERNGHKKRKDGGQFTYQQRAEPAAKLKKMEPENFSEFVFFKCAVLTRSLQCSNLLISSC
jgi:hypothetical protein